MSAKHLAYLALAAICVIWGTTYTGIKIAIEQFPPYLLVGLRQTLGGMVLLLPAIALGTFRVPERSYLLKQMLMGFLTITGGNGLITWGMMYISSGLSAVIGSLTPIMVLLINLSWRGGETISWRALLGVFVGFGGLGLLFRDGWSDFSNSSYQLGIAAAFGSCLTWSLGTVMAKRYNNPQVSPIHNAGMQLLFGGLFSFLLHPALDPPQAILCDARGWIALLYLALIGSALAFSLYMFTLNHLSATVSSLYTYVNPVVAILLGWLWLKEPLSPATLVGMAVTIVGVWLVNTGSRTAT
jgi:drug/metabolite transporter (DMT)-like permease